MIDEVWRPADLKTCGHWVPRPTSCQNCARLYPVAIEEREAVEAEPVTVTGSQLPSWEDALSGILERSAYVPPNPWMDLPAAHRAITDFLSTKPSVPADTKDLLLMFLAQVEEMLRPAAPPPVSVDVRGIYSGGYYSGQRLSAYPEALAASERERERTATDLWYVSLGALHYRDGFSDGWHGRPPAMPLDFTRWMDVKVG